MEKENSEASQGNILDTILDPLSSILGSFRDCG